MASEPKVNPSIGAGLHGSIGSTAENPATHVLLALLLQAGGLVIVITLAGIDDTVANLMLLLMVGLLLLFMIMNAQKFTGIIDTLTNVEQGA